MSRSPSVKLSLHLSPDTNEILEQLCKENHYTKSDLLRRAIALIQVALKYKRKGDHHLIVVNDNDEKVSEIIGL